MNVNLYEPGGIYTANTKEFKGILQKPKDKHMMGNHAETKAGLLITSSPSHLYCGRNPHPDLATSLVGRGKAGGMLTSLLSFFVVLVHFRVAFSFCFKTSPGTQLFISK